MTIQDLLNFIAGLLNNVVLPAIVALAFLFFMVNAFRYFILGGANPDDQEKARTLAVWGIAAFVVLSSLWGMVNILVDAFGLEGSYSTTPDYLCENNWGGCVNGDR
jgi:heme/copper-type cytochrome/quinol oxidase subunit 4